MIVANGTTGEVGSDADACPLIFSNSGSSPWGFSKSAFGRQAIMQHTWTSPRAIRSARSRIAWNSARTAGARLSASRGSAVPKERVQILTAPDDGLQRLRNGFSHPVGTVPKLYV